MNVLVAAQIDQPGQNELDPLVSALETSLGALGRQVDVFRFSSVLEPVAAMECALAMGLIDLGADADRLITVGWSCHLLRHPSKIAVISRHDPVLALLDASATRPDRGYIRTAVIGALHGARRIVVHDRSASQRLSTLTGLEPFVGGADLAGREAAGTWLD